MRRDLHRIALALALALACVSVCDAVAAAPPPGAIPVYCMEGVGIGGEDVVTCRRADTRAAATPVPAGLFLFITDLQVEPNNAATSGTFKGVVGLQTAASLPAQPRLDLIGSPRQRLRFRTPFLVLHAGEELAVANLASSDFPIDLHANGYLAATFTEAPPDALFRDGFEN